MAETVTLLAETNPDKYRHDGSNGNNIDAVNILAEASKIIAKRNAGAISKCSPEVIAGLEEAITEGMTVQQAADKNGISVNTYYRWVAIVPGFREAMTHAHQLQATARMYRHQSDMDSIDVTKLDPKLAMAHLRRQEQAARLDLEIAKRRDPATWGDKQLNVNVNATLTDEDISKWFNR